MQQDMLPQAQPPADLPQADIAVVEGSKLARCQALVASRELHARSFAAVQERYCRPVALRAVAHFDLQLQRLAYVGWCVACHEFGPDQVRSGEARPGEARRSLPATQLMAAARNWLRALSAAL